MRKAGVAVWCVNRSLRGKTHTHGRDASHVGHCPIACPARLALNDLPSLMVDEHMMQQVALWPLEVKPWLVPGGSQAATSMQVWGASVGAGRYCPLRVKRCTAEKGFSSHS